MTGETPVFRWICLPKLAFHSLIDFFELRVRIRANFPDFFDERRVEFFVLQLAEINPHVQCRAFNARSSSESADTYV